VSKGYLAMVLHAHLPYVRHPEYDEFLEEDWLYEAITETYIPLINVFDSLINDGVDFRITMSLTPTLMAMLQDPLLQDRYLRKINKMIELAYREVERTKYDSEFHHLAMMYRDLFLNARYIFEEKYGRNLIKAFKRFAELGKLEIITCTATHGFLPLLQVNEQAVRAQVAIGCKYYKDVFGWAPKGIWLAECAYYPGLDKILADNGIRFFFVDSHGVIHADSRPRYGVYAPIYCPTGVAAFARDPESSHQVWSAELGYPGDVNYRDFYRDVGFDLDFDYVRPYIHPDGIRKMTGVKYYSITGKTPHKRPYNPHRANEIASSHAGNFMFNREKQIDFLFSVMRRKPIVVAPYDAELYGHWWFEGPKFIEHLFRKIAGTQDVFKTTTPWEYLREYPKNQMATPTASSWGDKGFNEVWLNGTNDWVYPHLHVMADRMVELANKYSEPDQSLFRALNQAARELLLAQSSDWPFIMNSGTMVEYAVKRAKDHIYRFNKLYDGIMNFRLDMNFLSQVEHRDNIFPHLDYRVYRTV
jgi:1,4-alpha-glucan branching enzyme